MNTLLHIIYYEKHIFFLAKKELTIKDFQVICSDVPDLLSGSGSSRILPILSDIRIRPGLNLKKKSGSGSGRILI